MSKARRVEMTVTYQQIADSCSVGDSNDIRVEILDAGNGPYIVLVTERWAIDPDEIDAFAEMLHDLVTTIGR